MRKLIPFDVAPGIVTEATERGAAPRWRDADRVRFRYGWPEKIGGWVASGDKLAGVPRRTHDWASLDGRTWIAAATHLKLYIRESGSVQWYDITPVGGSGTLGNNPFLTTSGSSEVLVSHAAHNIDEDTHIRFEGATPGAGIDMNGEWQVDRVIDSDTYAIIHTDTATASAFIGGAAVDYEQDINAGQTSTVVGTGWGTGGWGEGTWGTPRESGQSEFVVPARTWSLDNWGEDLIASYEFGPIFHWDRSNGPGVRAQQITGNEVPVRTLRTFVSQQDRHLIALGANNLSVAGGAFDPLLVRWCDQEDFTDWEPTSTNTAGEKRIESGSRLMTSAKTKPGTVLFTDQSVHLMSFIGGDDTYAFDVIAERVSVIGPNAVTPTDYRVFVMCAGDFYIYDGGLIRPMPCAVRNHVFGDINRKQVAKVYAGLNSDFTEVWWFYPSRDSQEVNRYVILNYEEGTWSIGELARTAWGDRSSAFNRPYAMGEDGQLYTHEDGNDDNGAPMSAYLESFAAEIGSGDEFVQISHLVPDFLELEGQVDVTVRGRRYPQSPTEVVRGPYPVRSDTEWVRMARKMRARQMVMRVESGKLGDRWRMGQWRLKQIAHGKR